MKISSDLWSYTWPVKGNVFHDPQPYYLGGGLRDSPPFIGGTGTDGAQWMALTGHSRWSIRSTFHICEVAGTKTSQDPTCLEGCLSPPPLQVIDFLNLYKLWAWFAVMKHLNWSVNLLKPTGHVMHQQFNIQQLYVLPTLYLCVLYLSENKQRLVPLTA